MVTHRPTILTCNGLVAAGHPLATLAGVNVLQQGGNAVDAAIAAAAVLSVVEPHMSGLGGDVFLLIWSARAGRAFALNGSGAAPRRLGALPEQGIPQRGLLAATVPGVVAGWVEAHRRFGSLEFADLLRPAITYAEQGFPVSARLARGCARYRDLLAAAPASARAFLPDGRPPQAGRVLVQADLARSLRRIAEQGAGAFYEGSIAEQLVRFSRDHGGLFAAEDLATHRSVWADPLRTSYHGFEVLAQPPVSQGLILLEELNIIESDDLGALGRHSAASTHLMVEAKKLAFADRYRFLGDPAFVDVPVDQLLSRVHARALRQRVDPAHAADDPGSGPVAGDHTTYLATVDRDGNAVSLIQSVFDDFGSGVVVEGTGVLLNNRLAGFTPDPASPNCLLPGKRPVQTLNNCLVLRGGRPVLVLGSPGGDGQVQFVFQLLVDLLDFGVELQEAIEAPRWRSERGRLLKVEAHFPPETLAALERLGHVVEVVPLWSEELGGAQAIYCDQQAGVLHGAADPRREGYALGW